ncbi:MAG: AAA family ATPase [Gammaproteobacteria bacterium]|nr:AAA family ATPase [Gammaproteobacteria bacterium]
MASFLRPTALKLRNFKGIAELELTLDGSLTLLAGVNGVGKTSVLQALLAAVTQAWWAKPPHDYPQFRFSESVTRAGSTNAEILLELDVPSQAPIGLCFEVKERQLHHERSNLPQLIQYCRDFQPPLPLVVYYEQNRVPVSGSSWRNVSISSTENRTSSLHTTASSPREFKAWFFEKEADEGLETRERQNLEYADSELATVRGLLTQLDEFEAIRSRKPPESGERTLYLEKDGVNIPFDSLSGGEQAFFLLAADLARRLMLESPGMPIREAPGIVCIDEIELHLHPAWQKKILKTLMDTFPACQFVVTTHSPQVIGGVEAHHVRLLEPVENGIRAVSQPIATKGRDSNYVLKGILDTPERDDEVSTLFDEFDRLIDDGELEDAEKVLDKLDSAVEGESSRVAVRRAKWNRLRRTEA